MSKFFINRPIVAMVIAIFFVIAGVVMVFRLPVAQFPDIVPPKIQTTAVYTGADALTVEQSVATPIEEQVNGAKNMIYMQSINGQDGTMTLQSNFEVGTDVDLDQVQVQNRLSQALPSLPAAVSNYGLTTQQTVGLPLLVFAISSPHHTWDQTFLANYTAINIEDELARIPGIGQVKIFGAANYAMRIWVAPDTLAKLQLTVNDIVNAILAQNVVNPAGTIGGEPAPPGQQLTVTVRAQGRLLTAEEFGDIILRANPDGSLVRLKDVARIQLGAESYNQQAYMNGAPSSLLLLYQNPGSNALAAANLAKARMAELARHFPGDMAVTLTLDTTVPVTEGAREIVVTLLEAIGLVVLVVFIFLQDWRATLIPILTIPVSLVGAFMFFPAVGFSVNTLSLLGLVLAVGLVVDDAIVVVEAITAKIEQGKAPRDAALEAMDEVGGALVGIALVLSAVFIPTAFMAGITGSLYRQFALTIAFSVIISAFNALTLSPALGALLLRPKGGARSKGPLTTIFALFNAGFARATNGYVSVSGLLIRKFALALAILVGFAILAGGIGRALSLSFLPDEDQGYFIINVELPEAASLQRTVAVMREIGGILKQQPGVRYSNGIAGFSVLSQTTGPRNAVYFCLLTPYPERRTMALQSDAIVAALNRKFAGLLDAQVFAFQPPAIPGIGQASGLDFFIQDRGGHDVDYLWRNTQKFLAAAHMRPEFAGLRFTFSPSVPQLFAAVDKDKVFKLGVSIDEVYRALQTLLGGYYVNQFQPFRAGVEGVRRGGAAVPDQGDGSRTVLRAQQRGHDGAAFDAGYDAEDVRPRIHHPLQRVPEHRNFRPARARPQHRRRDGRRRRGGRAGSATRHGLCLERDFIPASGGGRGRGRVRALAYPGVSDSRRAVRELVAAVQRAAERAGSGLRRLLRPVVAPLRQRHLRPDRSHHADRTVGQERDPDRRVRQGGTRAGRGGGRGRAQGRAPALETNPDDLVRVHFRPDAALVGARCGRCGAPADWHGHDRRDGVLERICNFPGARSVRRSRTPGASRCVATGDRCRGTPCSPRQRLRG